MLKCERNRNWELICDCCCGSYALCDEIQLKRTYKYMNKLNNKSRATENVDTVVGSALGCVNLIRKRRIVVGHSLLDIANTFVYSVNDFFLLDGVFSVMQTGLF